MIYNNNKYEVVFFKDYKGKLPVKDYLYKQPIKDRSKMLKYIRFLKDRKGYLDEPYSRHIKGKIRELRVDFANRKHRIFYFTFVKQTIILLHAFTKKTNKTPRREIKKAEARLKNIIINQ